MRVQDVIGVIGTRAGPSSDLKPGVAKVQAVLALGELSLRIIHDPAPAKKVQAPASPSPDWPSVSHLLTSCFDRSSQHMTLGADVPTDREPFLGEQFPALSPVKPKTWLTTLVNDFRFDDDKSVESGRGSLSGLDDEKDKDKGAGKDKDKERSPPIPHTVLGGGSPESALRIE